MAILLANTAPGTDGSPVKPGQPVHLGLKTDVPSPTVLLSTLQLEMGLSSCAHTNVLPEDATTLTEIGATVSFETSERRRPFSGASVTKSLVGNNIVLTRTSNDLADLGVYELTIPVGATSSPLGYFKFKTKAWATFSPDWCNLPDVVGMYFGVEHGPLNTAAYAFLSDEGPVPSILLSGPIQSSGAARPGMTYLAQDLDPSIPGSHWGTLALGDSIELFLRFNLQTSPKRVELWTRIASTPAPIYQGAVLLSNLSTFPNETAYFNGRPGPSSVARLFFGNAGRIGDVLELEDWALFPDYRQVVKDGLETSDHALIRRPDSPVSFAAQNAQLPTELDVQRWFPITGAGQDAPTSSFYFQPGRYSTPRHLKVPKTGILATGYEREEPSINSAGMVEAFLSAESTSLLGNLVGPGFVFETRTTGLGAAFKVLMLETPTRRTYGVASDDFTFTDASTYYTPSVDIDWSSPKLIRLVVDKRRERCVLFSDEEKVLDIPMSWSARVLTDVLTFPTTALTGTTLTYQTTVDGGATWVPRSHTFLAEEASLASLLLTLNVAWAGIIEVRAMGDRLGAFFGSTTQEGFYLDQTSTALGAGKLTASSFPTSFYGASTFPSTTGAGSKIQFGHPYTGNYQSTLNLESLLYATRYNAWETEDSCYPNEGLLPAFDPLNEAGPGSQTVDASQLQINKTSFNNSGHYRYYTTPLSFADHGGVLVDFSTYVIEYTDGVGQIGAASAAIDSGLTIFLGNKRVSFNFYNCGAYGRKIGILPGSGTETDILTQTALGKAFSASVDWSVSNRYRISVIPFDAIRVWSGSVVQPPILTIPWRNLVDGFDLPLDVTPTSIAFGHFNFLTSTSSSTTSWKYVRYSFSNGFDVAARQTYPNGYPKYLFGGRLLLRSEFDAP